MGQQAWVWNKCGARAQRYLRVISENSVWDTGVEWSHSCVQQQSRTSMCLLVGLHWQRIISHTCSHPTQYSCSYPHVRGLSRCFFFTVLLADAMREPQYRQPPVALNAE